MEFILVYHICEKFQILATYFWRNIRYFSKPVCVKKLQTTGQLEKERQIEGTSKGGKVYYKVAP